MTIPMEYQRASAEFEAFLSEAKDALDFTTRNPTYTTVQAVLLAFRRRLRPDQVLVFASALPPILRAIFVAGWSADEYVETFADRAGLSYEIQHLRANHNLSPDNALAIVAAVLRKHVDQSEFDAALRSMPHGSIEFWSGE